jgi:hypothetical protein
MIWTIVSVALTVVALANLVLLLGVAARIRVLHTAALSRTPTSRLPEVGRAVRAFEVASISGAPITDRALAAGTTIVGFFTTGCRKCARIRAALADAPPALPTVLMINGDPGDAETQAMGSSLVGVGEIAYFEDLAVARAFGVLGYPTLLRIEDGRIAAAGRALEDVGAAA